MTQLSAVGSPALEPETTTWLEMTDPSQLVAPFPERVSLDVRLQDPVDYALGRSLYIDVGGPWRWVDRLAWSDNQWRAYYAQRGVQLWTATAGATLAGYFELSAQPDGSTELAYFGLVPDCIGRGMGGALLATAIQKAWDAGASRVWVHTSSRDHAHALANYLARGFRIYRVETRLVPALTS